MFSDFDAKARAEDGGRGRRTVSLLIAGAIFAGLAVAIGGAIATAHAVIERREREVAVEFATLDEPEPEPEPEPPPPPPEPRPRRARPASVANAVPIAIPDARPDEAEGELTGDAEIGPFGEGEEDGTDPPRPRPAPVLPPPPPEPPPGPPQPPPRPPSQERIDVSPPELLSGCQRPDRPPELEGATAETITIYVRVVIGPDGRVLRASIEESHALIPDEAVLVCVRDRIYEPAHLPDGTAVPYPLRYAFTFVPDVL